MAKADRKTLRQTFDEKAQLYDKVRTGYPDALFDDLVALGGLQDGSEILEIGCGTGQATRSLAPKGYQVTCLELGRNLAELARYNFEKFPNVRVENSAFEDWNPKGSRFDMVFAATSWHWLDPELSFAKAAQVLKPGGHLAVLSSEDAFPEGFDPFFTEIRKFYKSIGEASGKWPPPQPDEIPDETRTIKRSGLFEKVQVRRYLWAVDYTAQRYIDFLETHSSHSSMNATQREKIFSEIRSLMEKRPGGLIHKHYSAILHVSRLKSNN